MRKVDDTNDIREAINQFDKVTRKANMKAMRSSGWRKTVHLWFAGFFSRMGDLYREIERDELRGKDDNYHDEY